MPNNKYRSWTPGETVTAANITDYLQKNVVIPCDSSADYPDSSIRREGMAIYDKALDKLLIYSGSATTGWTPPWNLPWGVVATTGQITSGGCQVVYAVEEGLGNSGKYSLTYPVVQNRRYRLSFRANLRGEGTTTGRGFINLRNGDSTGSTLLDAMFMYYAQFGVPFPHEYSFYETAASSTTVTRSLRIVNNSAGTAWNNDLSSDRPGWMIVEDIGPAGAPA